MFYKTLIAAATLSLGGCWQSIHTGDLTKAVYTCGSIPQVEKISEDAFGFTFVKCANLKGYTNVDQVVLPRQ
jgi:hypothetical protein